MKPGVSGKGIGRTSDLSPISHILWLSSCCIRSVSRAGVARRSPAHCSKRRRHARRPHTQDGKHSRSSRQLACAKGVLQPLGIQVGFGGRGRRGEGEVATIGPRCAARRTHACASRLGRERLVVVRKRCRPQPNDRYPRPGGVGGGRASVSAREVHVGIDRKRTRDRRHGGGPRQQMRRVAPCESLKTLGAPTSNWTEATTTSFDTSSQLHGPVPMGKPALES